MANVIIVAGDTGTGKTTSLENLNSEETFLINVLNKPLPFKGSKGKYNIEKKNLAPTDNYDVVQKNLDILFTKIKTGEKKTKNIIIDDSLFLMTTELFDRSRETGFTKFTEIGKHMQELIKKCIYCELDINIVFMFHTEDDYNEKTKVGKKIKTIGQLLEDKYNPIATVTTCLFTNVSYNENKEAQYCFLTNRTLIDGIEIPAKSPKGMFDLRISNDLSLVFSKMENYYKGI